MRVYLAYQGILVQLEDDKFGMEYIPFPLPQITILENFELDNDSSYDTFHQFL